VVTKITKYTIIAIIAFAVTVAFGFDGRGRYSYWPIRSTRNTVKIQPGTDKTNFVEMRDASGSNLLLGVDAVNKTVSTYASSVDNSLTVGEALVVNNNKTNQVGLELHGIGSGAPSDNRGGFIKWHPNPMQYAYVYMNDFFDIVFDNNLQASNVDQGNAYINCYSGDAKFADLKITAMKQDWTNAGVTIADLGTVTTVNIDGGTIDGVTLGTSCTQSEWDDAYNHSRDNSQAHSDYLINNGDDTTSGTLTAKSFVESSLVGWWLFNNGEAKDSSGNGNDGTLQNSASVSEDVLNLSYSTSDYVSVTNNNNTLDLTGSMSFSLWINPTALPSESTDSYPRILWTSNDHFSLFYYKALSKLQWKHETTGTKTRPAVTEANLFKNQWFQIAGVYDSSAGKIRLYINGVQKDEQDHTGTCTANWVWQFGDSTYTMEDCKIDDIRFYNRALSAAEIRRLYESSVKNYGHFNKIITGEAEIGDGTNETLFSSTGVQTMTGNARVIKNIYISAGGIKAPGEKPATFVLHGLKGAWQFDDAIESNQQTVSGSVKLPADMDITVAPSFYIGWSADGVSPGNCEWQFEYLYVGANSDTTAGAQETLTVTSTASSTSNGLVIEEVTGIDAPGANDKAMFWRITRLSASENDTISGTVEMHGNFFEYTANKLGTAL